MFERDDGGSETLFCRCGPPKYLNMNFVCVGRGGVSMCLFPIYLIYTITYILCNCGHLRLILCYFNANVPNVLHIQKCPTLINMKCQSELYKISPFYLKEISFSSSITETVLEVPPDGHTVTLTNLCFTLLCFRWQRVTKSLPRRSTGAGTRFWPGASGATPGLLCTPAGPCTRGRPRPLRPRWGQSIKQSLWWRN